MPTVLHPTVTDAGKAAAIAADAGGLELELTHLSFHDHYFVPDGTETAIPSEHVRVPIIGLRVNPTQIRLSGIWSDNAHLTNLDIGSIGVWAGSTLFAVYAKTAAPPFAVKSPNVDFVGFYEMALSVVPPNSVNVVISTDSALLAALVAHETAVNPHPQYVRKDRIAFEAGRMVGLEHASSSNSDLKFTLPNQDVTGGYVDGMRVLLATTLINNANMTAGLVGQTSYPVVKGAGIPIGDNDIVPDRFFELIFNATSFGGPYWILNLLGIDEQGLIIAARNTARTELLINGCFQINTEAKEGFFSHGWALDAFSELTIKQINLDLFPYISDHWRIDSYVSGVYHDMANVAASRLDPMSFPEANQSLPQTIKINRAIGDADTYPITISNVIRNKDIIRARGKRVILSFWAKKETAFADTLVANVIQRKNFTGGDKPLFEFSTPITTANYPITLTSSWQRFAVPVNIDTDTTQAAVTFEITPTATPSSADYQMYLAGVNLKIAEVDDGYTQVPDYDDTLEQCFKTYRGARGGYGTVINARYSDLGALIALSESHLGSGEALTTIENGTNTIKFSWINGGGTIAKSTATVSNWTVPPASWITGHSHENAVGIEFTGVTGDPEPGSGQFGAVIWLHDMIIDGRL